MSFTISLFPSTPFVGRIERLADISELLHDPSCRLLTLVGPGGIGKTRLAIQAAQDLVDEPVDRIYFTTVCTLYGSFPFILLTNSCRPWRTQLDYHNSRDADPKVQLFNYLQDKEMLLVLDNIEHLLSSPASFPRRRNRR